MRRKIIYFGIFLSVIFLASCDSLVTRSVEYIYSDATVIANSNTITDIVDDVYDSCVGIYSRNSVNGSTGSGVIIKNNNGLYYVITNYHVIEEMTEVQVYLGEEIYYDTTVVGYDIKNDLALLSFSTDIYGGTAKTLDIDSYEDALTLGETIIAIGCPLGLTYYNSVSTGVISRFHADRIQHDAAINPGNSGGALFNMQGHLIGINSSKQVSIEVDGEIVSVEGMGFAIPISTVKNFLLEIETSIDGVIARPSLGVTINVINKYISSSIDAAKLPSGINQAVIVSDINPSSPAGYGGIEIEDFIKSYNGVSITTQEELQAELYLDSKGDIIPIEVYRLINGVYITITLQVTL